MNKDALVQALVTRAEKDRLTEAANKEDMTLSALVRKLIRDYLKAPRP